MKYDIIGIDFPWPFAVYSEDTGEGRSAQSHYDTKALTWDDHRTFIDYLWPIMADNCVLCIWMVRPSMNRAMTDIEYWWNGRIAQWSGASANLSRCRRSQFDGLLPRKKDELIYKTELFTLIKTYRSGKPFKGLGYYSRANTEPCMLFVRGSMPRVDKGVDQVITYCPFDVPKRWRHSHKPPEWRHRVERLWPGKNYLEVFARPYQLEESPNWTFIGNEITNNDVRYDLQRLAQEEERKAAA